MIPRWHILWGAVFTLFIWVVAPQIKLVYLALVFLSSFLIDFDHYVAFVLKKRKFSLRKAFEYHNKEDVPVGRGDFHLFHTIEFHVLVGLLGILWTPFYYVFIGMMFHSLLDLFSLMNKGIIHIREYFFFNWLRNRF